MVSPKGLRKVCIFSAISNNFLPGGIHTAPGAHLGSVPSPQMRSPKPPEAPGVTTLPSTCPVNFWAVHGTAQGGGGSPRPPPHGTPPKLTDHAHPKIRGSTYIFFCPNV